MKARGGSIAIETKHSFTGAVIVQPVPRMDLEKRRVFAKGVELDLLVFLARQDFLFSLHGLLQFQLQLLILAFLRKRRGSNEQSEGDRRSDPEQSVGALENPRRRLDPRELPGSKFFPSHILRQFKRVEREKCQEL